MAQEKTWSPRQREILEAGGENIEVLAAAGAGKTSVLVEKIFRLISEPGGTDVDRLLVMTFTRAAAAEMKERLASKLTDAIEADPGNRRLLRQQMLLYGAQICTIDSFCQSVLKEFYSSVDIDPSYRTGDNAELKLLSADTVRELLEDLYAKGDKDFLDFVTCYTSAKDDSGLESYIISLAECAMSHPDPEGWLLKLFNENKTWNSDELLVSGKLADITAYAREMLEGIHSDALEAADRSGKCGFDKYRDAILEEALIIEGVKNSQTYEKMSSMFDCKFKTFPTKPSTAGDPDKAMKEECKGFRDAYKKKYDDLKKRFFSMDLETVLEIRNISAAAARTLISATIEYMKRLKEKKLDRNVLGFGDIAHFALNVLTDKDETGRPVPSSKAMILRKRYDWIFVDEYQDSNEIQEELVNAIAGPAGAAPYTFMVGDVKQSIYRFRMAKPELFMKRCELYRKNPKEGKVVVLDSNYRSLAGVLRSTNSVFCRAMRKEVGGIDYDDDASLKPGTREQEETKSAKTRVIVVEGETDSEISEAVKIVKKIAQDRGEYKGIAILLRTKVFIREYRVALEDAGIPVVASETTGFLKTFEIETMLDYLKIIDNPARDIPFVGALASPIGGFGNDELAQIRIEEGVDKLWCVAAREYMTTGAVPAIREKLVRFFDVYDTIRSMNLCRDLADCIERIYELTGFMTFCRALPNGEVRAANLNLLIDYAYAYEETSYSGLFSFVRYIEQLKSTDQDLEESETTEGADAVTITTIHSSKGLEYPVVIVGGMAKRFVELDANKTVITSSDYGVVATAIDPDRRIKMPTLMRSIVSNRMNRDMMGEELRLLYVAMTRAREELILIGSIKDLVKNKKPDEWEKVAQQTTGGTAYRFDYFSGQKTFLDFVVPAALADSENFEVDYVTEAAAQEKAAADEGTPVAEKPGTAESTEKKETETAEGTEKNKTGTADEGTPVAEKPGTAEGTEKKETETAGETVTEAGEHEAEGKAGAEEKIVAEEKTAAGKSREELLRFYREAVCREETEQTRTISAQLAYKYPYEEASKIPAKLSVSDIKRKHMEEGQEAFSGSAYASSVKDPVEDGKQEEILRKTEGENPGEKQYGIPNRKEAKIGKFTGADYGTLLHKVMRFLPFDLNNDGIEAYLSDLEGRGVLSTEEKDAIRRDDIEGFIASPVYARLRAASQSRTLRREQPFITGIPACEIDSELYGDSQTLIPVQGVIDCLFEEDGKVVVLDYKTDHRDEAWLKENYKPQLDLYMRAATAALGKPQGHKLIYSFFLKKCIEIE
ncbi:MAG: UvrD-helicase domain-containing protein [Lachnospiraceae bacterium]|nr:UvrD-helicase domain-containing protein [Lachnospiraceae bacterium]